MVTFPKHARLFPLILRSIKEHKGDDGGVLACLLALEVDLSGTSAHTQPRGSKVDPWAGCATSGQAESAPPTLYAGPVQTSFTCAVLPTSVVQGIAM